MARIVIATDAWEPQVNGVVRTLKTTIGVLQSRGLEVSVITPDDFRCLSFERALPDLKIALPPYHVSHFIDKADAVHISTEGPIGWAVRRYCNRKKIPYTTAFHTNFMAYLKDVYHVPESMSNAVFRYFHRDSRAVMVPTQSMIVELSNKGFKNLRHWGRGVDTTLFNPESKPLDDLLGLASDDLPRPFWLNVGRVSKEKNLEAFLNLDLPGTKFIVGDGPDLERLKAKYPKVKFLGVKKGEELAACYRTADVFVFPSKFDTFGLVNAEAISCGIPVAGFPVTGPIDIVKQGTTGFVDDNLRTACLNCLALKNVRDDFSWDRATDQFLSYLVMGATG